MLYISLIEPKTQNVINYNCATEKIQIVLYFVKKKPFLLCELTLSKSSAHVFMSETNFHVTYISSVIPRLLALEAVNVNVSRQ